MDGPCVSNSWPMWLFIVLGLLAHSRGVALLVREVALVLGRFAAGRRARGAVRRRRY